MAAGAAVDGEEEGAEAVMAAVAEPAEGEEAGAAESRRNRGIKGLAQRLGAEEENRPPAARVPRQRAGTL